MKEATEMSVERPVEEIADKLAQLSKLAAKEQLRFLRYLLDMAEAEARSHSEDLNKQEKFNA